MTSGAGGNATWVVVADGRRARLFAMTGNDRDPRLNEIDALTHAGPPSREQGTDRPGRRADGGAGHASSAYEETDHQQLEKSRFAKEVAGRVNKAAMGGRFERLVLIAAPRVLGDLRGELHKTAAGRVAAEVAKDLTNHDADAIAGAVRDALRG